jgi:acetyl-CoA carboxylase carboxyl transferase subunit alpha
MSAWFFELLCVLKKKRGCCCSNPKPQGHHVNDREVSMNPNYLDFEQPIAELEVKIKELRSVGDDNDLNISDEINKLSEKSAKLTEKIYSALSPWDIVRVARHPQRPYTLDYLSRIFTEFDELHGDRQFADDPAIVGGMAKLGDTPVMVIGQEKGRSVNDKVKRNFGMPRPEGYRKALRLMEMAERFRLPVITLIDTPGAYPGIDSEERGISQAIAQNLAVMSRLKTPIISVVIGEGSSGGALGIGVGDKLAMLQYATYFVISPEGCANIIWKSSDKAPEAAEAMGVTSTVLKELGIVDETIAEPPGGAHRDLDAAAEFVKSFLLSELPPLMATPIDTLLEQRYARLMSYGNTAAS